MPNYTQLWKRIIEFALSIKLAIGELPLVIWAIFEFVKTFAVGLIISEFALIEVTVYKYDLTFWH